VTGRVWDVGGGPAIGARVGLGRSTFEEGEERITTRAELRADDEGRYRLPATPRWTVRLWADSSCSIATILPPFEIAAGENRVEDIFLDPGLSVSGRVRVEAGASESDVVIELSASWPSEEVFPEFGFYRLLPKSLQPLGRRCLWTREDGTYLMSCVHPHLRLRVSAHHPALVARQGSIEVEAGATAVDFDLERVKEGSIQGRVFGVGEQDLTGIRVQVRADGGDENWTEATSVDSTGRFKIRINGGFAGLLRAVHRFGRHRPSPALRVVAAPGQIIEDLDLALGDHKTSRSPLISVK
jgi:hypothetical protein